MNIAAIFSAVLVGASPALAPPPVAADWRPVDAANTLVIDTDKGRIIAELYPEVAPKSVAQIEALTRRGFYDGLSFFRVIDGFMDQTGDPKNTGQGGSDLPNLPPEFSFKLKPGPHYPMIARAPAGGDAVFAAALPVISQPAAMAALTVDGEVTGMPVFCTGVVGMARASEPDSGNSQFFLMRGDKYALDGLYTAFGRVVVGEDVVRAIKTGEPVDAPQDRMLKVQLLADMPKAQRPNVEVIDTRGAYFADLAARTRAAKGDAFTPCDMMVQGKLN